MSQISRRGLEQYTLLSIRYLRVVGEGQNNTHYCRLETSDQQEKARTLHITVYQISQSSRKWLQQQSLLSIRYLRVAGEGQNNTHYCLLDISDQQEKARTLHITVYYICQCSKRARTIHATVYQKSQCSRRGLEQYALLSIRHLRVVGKGPGQQTLLSIRYLRVVGEGQNNKHYCLLDISDQQGRTRTIHITVYLISQGSRRGLEEYRLLSIRYLRLVGECQNNTHYCLLGISEQQERARTIQITVYSISQSRRIGIEQYTLLSIRYLRVVGEGQNNTHYCLLDISEQKYRDRTIDITVYQISQSSRRGLEQYTLLYIRYLRFVGEGENNTH